MNDKQRAGLAILLVVICAIQIGSIPEGPGVQFARYVFIFLVSVGIVMLARNEEA